MDPMNLAEAIEYTKKNRRQWRNSRGQGPATIRTNTAHGLRILGDMPCDEIENRHFTLLKNTLEDEGKHPGTINRI